MKLQEIINASFANLIYDTDCEVELVSFNDGQLVVKANEKFHLDMLDLIKNEEMDVTTVKVDNSTLILK